MVGEQPHPKQKRKAREKGEMAVVDANGHFNIPEGTTTIVGRDPWAGDGGGADSWAEWGVHKTNVRTVTIPE